MTPSTHQRTLEKLTELRDWSERQREMTNTTEGLTLLSAFIAKINDILPPKSPSVATTNNK